MVMTARWKLGARRVPLSFYRKVQSRQSYTQQRRRQPPDEYQAHVKYWNDFVLFAASTCSTCSRIWRREVWPPTEPPSCRTSISQFWPRSEHVKFSCFPLSTNERFLFFLRAENSVQYASRSVTNLILQSLIGVKSTRFEKGV